MLRLLVFVFAEAIVGMVGGGVLLAVAVPALNHYGLIGPDDLLGAVAITLVLAGAVGAMIFRPGSAINRYFRR